MKLHLPVLLRRSVLSCVAAVAVCTMGSGMVWADNLTFDGATLTWNTNTENKAFTNAAGESASFATGDNVTFASDASVSLGDDISAGQINIANGADVVIELADNGLSFDTLSMLGGSLDAGDSLNIAAGETLAVGSNGSVLKSDLVLEKNASLSVDYAGTGSATSLNNSALSLQGGTRLQLSGCGSGDGKTYTLLTGVSELKDAQGNAISLSSSNNAIAKYFDTSQPGTGFWADATLQLSADGILRLVRHSEAVKPAVTISTRRTGSVDYQYYEGVHFADIEYTAYSSSACGGAIYGGSSSTITLSNNGSVSFSGNTASGSASASSAYGGAIYGSSSSTITLSDNGSVTFSGNTAFARSYYACGGAIYGSSSSTITLSNNGSVSFSGNTASGSSSYSSAYGGAIYGRKDSTITLSGNGSVTFSGNTVYSSPYYSDSTASGGAIYTQVDLSIRNNDSVEFYKNAEVKGNTYRLCSIRAYGGSGDEIEISLSAAAWKSITFYDSVVIGSGATVNLNQDYTYQAEDGSSVTIRQQGDIVFTGKYTEQHLNDLLEAASAGRTATSYEILDSRTTYVYAMTNLFGGRLRVEEGVIYQGRGITAMEGSAATVRVQNAELSHGGYVLTFNAGTTLELAGNNTITGNVRMLEGSSLLFDLSQYQGVTIHSGWWDVAYGALVSVALDSSGWTGEWGEIKTIALLDTNANLSASRFDLSISPLTGNWGYSGLQWVEGTLSIAFKNGATNAEWTNAAGDFRWNNESCNWIDSGFTFARVNGADVTFGKSAEGSILLDGQMEVGKMTVSADAVYALDFATGASLTVQKDLVLGAGSDLTVHGNLAAAGVSGQGNLVVDGELNVTNAVTASSIQAGSLLADSLNLTNAENRGSISGDATVAGEVVAAGYLNVGGLLTASSLQAASLEAGSLILTGSGAGNVVTGALNVEGAVQSSADLSVGGAMSAQQVCVDGALTAASLQTEALEATSLKLTDATASNRIGSSVAMTGTVESAGSLTVEGTLTVAELTAGGALSAQQVSVAGALTAASLQTEALETSSLNLTDAAASNRIGSSVAMTGAVESAGSLTVEGALTAASVQTGALEVGSLVLTAGNTVNTVTGNLTADSVSLVAGSGLTVDGVLTANEVQMSGTALTLTAGSFGASSMNFELDCAALESLGLGYRETGAIAQSGASLTPGFVAILNGGSEAVEAAAYKYTISTDGNSVQLTADYAYDGMQVWYRGAWVGKSNWTDFYIAGYDAVNGVEQLNLNSATVQGANLYIAYEDGVTSAVVTNGTMEFDYVDMGGGQFEIGADATIITDELYGKGETLVLHDNAALNAAELTLGTLVLNDSVVAVKKATINVVSGTEGSLTIEAGGTVTVKSDVTLTDLTNEGSLNLGKKNLTVNALVDVGGNVTAQEVRVQSRGSRMAEFDKLVADKVTVVNSLTAGRYTDGLSVGNGSAIGELIAETLEVREGTVTLGRASSTEMRLLNLDLQEDAMLVLNLQTTLEVTDTLTATENATLQLQKDAAVSYDGMNISNRKESGTLSVNAYALSGETELELNGAHVAVTGSEDKVIDYKLVNSTVENAGSKLLTLTNSASTLSGLHATGGNVDVQALGDITLAELEIAAAKTISAASVTVTDLVKLSDGAKLAGNLTLASGATVDLGGTLTLEGALNLQTGLTLSGTVLETIAGLEEGQSHILFSGVTELDVQEAMTLSNMRSIAARTQEAVSYRELMDGQQVSAADYFSNLSGNTGLVISYNKENGTVSISHTLAVPEPTTATLSLLALAALAARRRRK